MPMDADDRAGFLSTGRYENLLRAAKYSCGGGEVGSEQDDGGYPASLIDRAVQRQEEDLDARIHGSVYGGLAAVFQTGGGGGGGGSAMGDDWDIVDVDATSSSAQLWPDKHTIGLVPQDVCGTQNTDTADNLVHFINEWRDNRHQIISTRAKKRRKQQKCPKQQTYRNDDDSDYEIWDDSEEEDNGLCKVFLLTGPSGSGKTSLLYAAAKKCHCLVLEINTAAKRGGQDLKKAIEESTQSHSSFANIKEDNATNNKDCVLRKQTQKKSDSPSLALVLIDEVDLLFESDGDIGFWQSLTSLTKNAKCPIILTSTTIPPPLLNTGSISYIHGPLANPTPTECATKMIEIAELEGMAYNMEESGSIRHKLEAIAKLCNCDLRKIINCMELFSRGRVNFDTRLQFGPVNSDNDCCPTAVSRNPHVYTVSPRVVSSTKHTVIHIQGKNFMALSEEEKDSSVIHTAKLEVVVGNQICPASQVLNDGTILAVCPPCLLPSGVDRYGTREDTFEECLTCRFVPIVVKIRLPNGMIIRSDTPSCRISKNDAWTKNLPNIEYSFPDQDSTAEPSLDDEDASIATLLDKEVTAHRHKLLQSSECHKTCILSAQKPASSVEENGKVLNEMLHLMRNAELASDAALLEDAHLTMCVPQLSGPVRGFGTETGRQDNKKHRSKESLVSHDWDDSSFFFGTSDTYMTRPMCQTDRYLAAESHNTCQDLVLSQSDVVTLPCALSMKDSTELDDKEDIDGEVPISQVEESTFSHSSRLLPIRSLPTMLRTAMTDLSGFYFRLECDVRSYLIEYEKEQKSGNLLKLAQPLIGKLMTTPRHLLVLDYAPILRNMAYLESITETNFNDSIKDKTGDDLPSAPTRITTRRRARNGPKGREHYFDKLLKRNGSVSFFSLTPEMGKVSGANLTDLCLVNQR